MAREGYVKQTWEDGVSPVNAERLNKMEEGIALGVNLAQEALDSAGSSGGGGVSCITIVSDQPKSNLANASFMLADSEMSVQDAFELYMKGAPVYLKYTIMSNPPLAYDYPAKGAVLMSMAGIVGFVFDDFESLNDISYVIKMDAASGTISYMSTQDG